MGIAFFLIGGLALLYLTDQFYPYDVEQRLDLTRLVPQGRADATMLWRAALPEVIVSFLALALITATGLVLPAVFLLNKRFGQWATSPYLITLRQSFWVGLWVALCLLLQMNRTLSFSVAALLAVVLAIFEFMLQVRTRAAGASTNASVE